MSNFLPDLWTSIFTPGPTPTLLVATNTTFGALQLTLLVLLIATSSIHFVIMSMLCAGLWWSINWFATEITRARAAEDRETKQNDTVDDTTRAETAQAETASGGTARKRELVGSKRSGELSTDSEWDKLDEDTS